MLTRFYFCEQLSGRMYTPNFVHCVSVRSTHPACALLACRVAELTAEQQAVLEPPGIRRPELDSSTRRLSAPLDSTRITYPPASLSGPPLDNVSLGVRNPTGSQSYQATRGGNEDGG